MNNDIKEKLDNLRIYAGREENGFICDIEDYITNLQTIEQQYSAILSENAELENKITNLQEEYKKEHYLVDKLTRQLNDEYKNTEYQCKQKEYYKSRNEKAIEYIKMIQSCCRANTLNEGYINIDKLLNILEGDDKDE